MRPRPTCGEFNSLILLKSPSLVRNKFDWREAILTTDGLSLAPLVDSLILQMCLYSCLVGLQQRGLFPHFGRSLEHWSTQVP